MSYLREDNGKGSSSRIIFVVGTFWNMAMTSILVYRQIDPLIAMAFFSGIEGVLIGIKLGQKPLEQKAKKDV